MNSFCTRLICLPLFLFFFGSGAEAETETIVPDNQPYNIVQENIIFAGHATAFWDSARKTEKATKEILEAGRKNGIYRIATIAEHMMADPKLMNLHYLTQDDVDLIVTSRAGSHRLEFPNLKNIIFVGGNLNRCLCEGIRDVAIGLNKNQGSTEVNFFLVTDGIYAAYAPYSPINKAEIALDFSKSFFTPAFRCPLQNWGRATERRVPMNDLKLNIYFENELLASLDAEPNDNTPIANLNQVINIHFVEAADILTIIEGF